MRCLLYIAAVRLCPAVRKRARLVGIRHAAGAQGIGIDAIESFATEGAQQGGGVHATAIFSKVLRSMPFTVQRVHQAGGFDILVCRLNKRMDGMTRKKEDMGGSGRMRLANARRERPEKNGFDLIRKTFNLARGNIEEQFFCPGQGG